MFLPFVVQEVSTSNIVVLFRCSKHVAGCKTFCLRKEKNKTKLQNILFLSFFFYILKKHIYFCDTLKTSQKKVVSSFSKTKGKIMPRLRTFCRLLKSPSKKAIQNNLFIAFNFFCSFLLVSFPWPFFFCEDRIYFPLKSVQQSLFKIVLKFKDCSERNKSK